MKKLTVPVAYGYQELRLLQKRYMTWSLIIALGIQFIVLGSYHGMGWLKPGDVIGINKAPIGDRIFNFIPLPPPLDTRLQSIGVPLVGTKILTGTPTPVPDAYVDTTEVFSCPGQLPSEVNENPPFAGNFGVGNYGFIPPEPDPSPDTFQPTEVDPEIILKRSPDYPVLAQRINLEGVVYVKVLVDKKGNVKKAIVLKSDAELLTQPAIDAAMKWFFKPALMNGKPVAVWVSIPFHFRLTK